MISSAIFGISKTILVVSFATLLLAGCEAPATKPGSGGSTANVDLQAALQQLNSWSVNASVGIWTEETVDTPEQNITASMQWQERADALEVVLRGPLGVGEMSLSAAGNKATLKRGSSVNTDTNASRLVQRALGLSVPVPLSELSFWMRGLPGSATEVSYDVQGRMHSLNYVDELGNEWQAIVRRYTSENGVMVPRLITAKGGPYNVRLALRDWIFDRSNIDQKPSENDSDTRLRIPGRSS